MSLKIYIAAPYSAETVDQREKNTKIAIDAAICLYKKGYSPYIPHLTHWVDKQAKESVIELNWEDYMRWHKPWLEACDALLYFGSSRGTDIELEIAKYLGKIIYYSAEEAPVLKTKETVST